MAPRAEVIRGELPGWARLASDGPLYASPGWLRAMAGRLGPSTVTLVVRAGNRTRLAARAALLTEPRPGELFDLHHVLVSQAPALPLTDGARAGRAVLAAAAPEPRRWTPNLVVMLPGYECVPVGPGREDPDALGLLVDAALDWAGRTGLRAVAFLYTRPEAVTLASTLTARGFTAVPLSLTWDLAVPPGGLPAYLAMLPRKRRQDVTRELLRLHQAGVELVPVDAASPGVLSTLAGLRCQLVRKYRGSVDERVERDRLAALVYDVAGGSPTVLAAVGDGVTLGFALFVPYGLAWHCLAVGYDYQDPRSRMAYFGTAFYAAIPVAAEAGARRIAYGQGASRAKRARGCAGTVLTAWVRAFDPDLAAAARASARVTALLPASV